QADLPHTPVRPDERLHDPEGREQALACRDVAEGLVGEGNPGALRHGHPLRGTNAVQVPKDRLGAVAHADRAIKVVQVDPDGSRAVPELLRENRRRGALAQQLQELLALRIHHRGALHHTNPRSSLRAATSDWNPSSPEFDSRFIPRSSVSVRINWSKQDTISGSNCRPASRPSSS